MLLHCQSQSLPGGPTKNLYPVTNTLSHCCQSLSSCCQVQYLDKTKENTVLPRAYSLPVTSSFSQCCQLQSLSSCCQVQYLGENGLAMGLTNDPSTILLPGPFSVTLLPAPEPLILLPGTGPGTKQRKTLGWCTKNLFPASYKHSLTLQTPIAGRKPKRGKIINP